MQYFHGVWTLQWSRDQLIAEMIANMSWGRSLDHLQWSRDQLIAEIRCVNLIAQWGLRLQWSRDQLIAEMPVPLADGCAENSLQWSRDQLIAEMRSFHRASDPSSVMPLQWSRDQLIAEMPENRNALRALANMPSMEPRSTDRGDRTSG